MPNVIITPVVSGGSAVILPQFGEISYGPQDDVTFSWQTPLDDVYWNLDYMLSKNVQIERNRNGTYVAIADPGAEVVCMEWTEYELDTRTPLNITRIGIITSGGALYRNLAETTTITLWPVDWLFIRATGESYDLTGMNCGY